MTVKGQAHVCLAQCYRLLNEHRSALNHLKQALECGGGIELWECFLQVYTKLTEEYRVEPKVSLKTLRAVLARVHEHRWWMYTTWLAFCCECTATQNFNSLLLFISRSSAFYYRKKDFVRSQAIELEATIQKAIGDSHIRQHSWDGTKDHLQFALKCYRFENQLSCEHVFWNW